MGSIKKISKVRDNVTRSTLRNHYCCAETIGITYSECVFVVLVIKYAVRTRRIILSSVVCLGVPYFLIFHKYHDFRKKKITGHKICVLLFSTKLSETFLFLRRLE